MKKQYLKSISQTQLCFSFRILPLAELIQRKMEPGLQMRWLKTNPVAVIGLSPGLEADVAMAIWASRMAQLEVIEVPGILEPVQGYC